MGIVYSVMDISTSSVNINFPWISGHVVASCTCRYTHARMQTHVHVDTDTLIISHANFGLFLKFIKSHNSVTAQWNVTNICTLMAKLLYNLCSYTFA